MKDGLAARFAELHVGDVIKGVVTGVVDFGVFVNVEGIEGLIHISECKHGYMDNVHDFVKVGQEVTAKVIDVDEFSNKISLSIRALEKLECARCSATH